MKVILLTQGKQAMVDDEDFDRINRFKWFAFKNRNIWYAGRNDRSGTRRKTVYLHHEVLMCPTSRQVDHRDRDALNNQKHNLRFASNAQNQMNKIGWSSLGVKGVHHHPKARGSKHYQARIQLRGRSMSLGYFKTLREAAAAYNRKAFELFGEFARLNPI